MLDSRPTYETAAPTIPTLPSIRPRRFAARAWENLIDALQRRLVQLHLDRTQRAFELLHRTHADNRRRYSRLRQQPCERYRILALPKLVAQRAELFKLRSVLLQALRIAAPLAAAAMAGVACEQTAVERAPRYDAKAKRFRGWQHFKLRQTAEQIVLMLLADEAQMAARLRFTLCDSDVPACEVARADVADFALLLLDALPGARRRFTGDTVGWLRSRKDAEEYRRLKQSQRLNDRAMAAGFAALRAGVTELEIARVIADFYEANGAGTEFCSVCFGANGAFPHHHTGDTRLAPGDAVLIDTGCRLDGYPSDMTRVGHYGGAPEGFAEVHAILDRAVEAAIAAVRPGVRASAADKAARDLIAAAGYGPEFLHRTGHGLGIDVHEPPYITATSDTVLDEGMVFSIEPGIYLPGRFGLRLEEIVIIRDGKPEILSELPRTAIAAG